MLFKNSIGGIGVGGGLVRVKLDYKYFHDELPCTKHVLWRLTFLAENMGSDTADLLSIIQSFLCGHSVDPPTKRLAQVLESTSEGQPCSPAPGETALVKGIDGGGERGPRVVGNRTWNILATYSIWYFGRCTSLDSHADDSTSVCDYYM